MSKQTLTADLLNIYQTAELLGVSTTTVYEWTDRGYMPAPIEFGRWRWRRSELRQWAKAGFPRREVEQTKGQKAKA